MTTADLLKRMHDYDIKMHPYALYCNPADAEKFKERIPNTVKLVPLSVVDEGISYLVNRTECEKELYIPGYSLLGGDTDGKDADNG